MPGRRRRENAQLDAKDLKILDVVQRCGRIPLKALSREIGLSVTPCAERLVRLEQAGVLSGYRGIVDTGGLGSFLWAHAAVVLARHRAEDFERFEAAVDAIPEVIECDAVGGGIDYLLKLLTRDVDHYQQVMGRLFESDAGVEKFFMYVVTKRTKRSAAIPLASLVRRRSR